ncbi:MAG: phosphoribosyltransferase [Lewinellaceae bacterium]|nr:phosphoribosyltransferase [Lewinellaceae bacterium]
MKILNEKEIARKIQRLAIEILENNFEEPELIILGINNRGLALAQKLKDRLEQICALQVTLSQLRISPADPLSSPVEMDYPVADLQGKAILVVDDVANTGRTIFYACKPLMDTLPKKVEVAVLVDRQHKSFPIKVDYVGLSLATTLKENIDVQIGDQETAAFLQ